jgi:D-alanyl-D-alanine carboxypeptidase
LLNHTSALPDLDREALKAAIAAEPDRRWTTLELLNFTAEQRPTRPRGLYTYAATNYLLLELMIERVTGQSFAEEIQTRIIKPLQLKDTAVGEPDNGEPDNKAEQTTDLPLPQVGLVRRENEIISNAPDLIRFMQALFLDDELLNSSAQTEMLTTVETRRGSYGLGIVNTMTRWGEVWGQVNSATDPTATVLYIPVHDLILVSWSGGNQTDNPRPMEMIDSSLAVVLGKTSRPVSGATVQW